MKSEILNHDANSDSKMDDNQIRLKAITLSINDNFPSLKLHFIEKDRDALLRRYNKNRLSYHMQYR